MTIVRHSMSAAQASIVESRANRAHSGSLISKGELDSLASAAWNNQFDDMQEAAELAVLRSSGRYGERYMDSDNA